MPIGGISRLPYAITCTSAGALTMGSVISEGVLEVDGISGGVLVGAALSGGDLSTTLESGGSIMLTIYNPKTDEVIEVGGNEMATITAYKGDYGYDLMFTVTDADGDAFDLSLATAITLNVGKADGSAVKFTGTCVAVSPTDGEFAYTTRSTDFDTVGDYVMQIVITFSGKKYTIGGMTLTVDGALPLIGSGVL